MNKIEEAFKALELDDGSMCLSSCTKDLSTVMSFAVLPFYDPTEEYPQHLDFLKPSRTQPLNTTGFRFLNLPHELRNLVYEFALGGQNIHIKGIIADTAQNLPIPVPCLHKSTRPFALRSYRQFPQGRCYKFLRTLCDLPCHYSEAYEASKANFDKNAVPATTGAFICTDEACRSKLEVTTKTFRGLLKKDRDLFKSRLPLNLLRSCRQVYEEAALLSFTLNTFSFASLWDFSDFATLALSKGQREAIQRVHVSIHEYQCSDGVCSELKQSTLDALPELKELYMTMDTTIWQARSESLHLGISMSSPDTRGKCRPDLQLKVMLDVEDRSRVEELQWRPRDTAFQIEQMVGKGEDAKTYGWTDS